MKILFVYCGLLLFSSLSLFAQAEAELLKKVKLKLDKVNDYKAEGKMKIDVSFIDAPTTDVSIFFKKPNRFKVKKTGGISILPKGGVSINMATLLAGADYDIVPGRDAVLNGIKTRVIKLLPTKESADVVLTTLYIEEKTLVINRATVTTRENGTYQIDLVYGKYVNWGLPDKVVFTFNTKDFKLPKGITFEYEKGETKKQPGTKNNKGIVEINYRAYIINKGVDDKIFTENK